jgi:hypothetical protein
MASHRGLYLVIIMDPYGEPLPALTIALHRGLYLAILILHYEKPHTAITIHLYRVVNLTITMDGYGGSTLPLL